MKRFAIALSIGLVLSQAAVALVEETITTPIKPTTSTITTEQPTVDVPATTTLTQPTQTTIEQPIVAPQTTTTPLATTAPGNIITGPAAATVQPQPSVIAAEAYFNVAQAGADIEQKSLRKKYQAVAYTLTNSQPAHIEIMHAEVLGAIDEHIAQQEVLQAKNKKRRFGGALGKGLLGAGLSALPYTGAFSGAAGYQTARAVGVASNAANAAMDANLQSTVPDFTGRYVKKFNDVIVSPSETFTFTSLVPKKETPKLKLVFKNLQTNQIYTVFK